VGRENDISSPSGQALAVQPNGGMVVKIFGGEIMSRKNLGQHLESQNVEIPNEVSNMTDNMMNTAKDTIAKVGETVSNNKLLIGGIIGGIAVGCGAAIYLLTTDSGKRVRSQIQDRVLDAYDDISEQLSDQWDRLSDLAKNVLSETRVEDVSEDLRNVA
jgi:gas vesicle protein